MTELFHLAQYSLASSTSLQMARFHSYVFTQIIQSTNSKGYMDPDVIAALPTIAKLKGRLGGTAVERLPSAQGMILALWDRAPYQAPPL